MRRGRVACTSHAPRLRIRREALRIGPFTNRRRSTDPPTTWQARKGEPMQTLTTPYGRLDVDTARLELGELLVSDDGVELEVVSLEPLRFEPAPEEAEDWGE